MSEFEFEEWRERFPEHWDEHGWPALDSKWRSRNYPHLRVSVVARGPEYATAIVYWDGDLDGLRQLFTHEPVERWGLGTHGVVQTPAGIGPWEEDGPDGPVRYWVAGSVLPVKFERAKFGGPDTWHINFEEAMPFFEPIPDWERGHEASDSDGP